MMAGPHTFQDPRHLIAAKQSGAVNQKQFLRLHNPSTTPAEEWCCENAQIELFLTDACSVGSQYLLPELTTEALSCRISIGRDVDLAQTGQAAAAVKLENASTPDGVNMHMQIPTPHCQ